MDMLSENTLSYSVCYADINATVEVSKQIDEYQIVDKKTSSRIVLASQSEHRKKAMNILGLSYECIPANIDEKAIRNPDPLKMALMISEAKALFLGNKEKGSCLIETTIPIKELILFLREIQDDRFQNGFVFAGKNI